MADINAWSIIVPGVVTPAVVAGFAFSQQRTQRRQAARDELRVVLDDAAAALSEAEWLLIALHESWKREELPDAEDTEDIQAVPRPVRRALDRLIIRVGDDTPVARAYNAAYLAQLLAFRELTDGLKTQASFSPVATERLHAAQDANEAFLRVAKELVGHDRARRAHR